MKKSEKAMAFAKFLEETYPGALCTLDYLSPFQLLVSVQLAAQCTDARVNLVTPALFEKYPDSAAFAAAKQSELEDAIRSTGFFRNKAKNLIACAKRIEEVYGGKIPDNMDDLLTLAGVGRKSANLILGDVFGKGGMVIDTHAKRIFYRVGLTKNTDPYKIEKDLNKLIPREIQSEFCHRTVEHGRALCPARRPKCEACGAAAFCSFAQKNKK